MNLSFLLGLGCGLVLAAIIFAALVVWAACATSRGPWDRANRRGPLLRKWMVFHGGIR